MKIIFQHMQRSKKISMTILTNTFTLDEDHIKANRYIIEKCSWCVLLQLFYSVLICFLGYILNTEHWKSNSIQTQFLSTISVARSADWWDISLCKYQCGLFYNDLEVFPFYRHHISLIELDPWLIYSDQTLRMITRNQVKCLRDFNREGIHKRDENFFFKLAQVKL